MLVREILAACVRDIGEGIVCVGVGVGVCVCVGVLNMCVRRQTKNGEGKERSCLIVTPTHSQHPHLPRAQPRIRA